MKMMKLPLLSLIISVLCVSLNLNGYGQPANDEYTGAVLIPINSAVSGTTVGATKSSQPALNDSEGHHDDDVWFKFVPAGDDYTLNFNQYTTIPQSQNRGFVEIFEADAEGKPGVRIWSQTYGFGSLFSPSLVDLNEEKTYFIRVYTRGTDVRANFNIRLDTIAVTFNDDCETAVHLSPDDLPWGTLTVAGATESLPAGNCATGAAQDVWLMVKPLQSGDFIVMAKGDDFDIVMDVYKGGCNSLQPVQCVNSFGADQAEELLVNNVNAGEIHYMRVYRQSDDAPISSGGLIMYVGGNALPVKLSSFEVVSGEVGGALLNWTTTEEVNSSYFRIQHSVDGKAWINIGQLPVSQNTGSGRAYSFVHHKPHSFLVNYYRLEMVDLDGTSTISSIVSWKGGSDTISEKPFKIYPNPASDWLQLEDLRNDRPFAAEIVDAGGVIKPVEISADGRIDIRHLISGVYILKVTGEVGPGRNCRFVVTR